MLNGRLTGGRLPSHAPGAGGSLCTGMYRCLPCTLSTALQPAPANVVHCPATRPGFPSAPPLCRMRLFMHPLQRRYPVTVKIASGLF